MGRFSVEIELANNKDVVLAGEGRIKPEQIRRVKLQGVVDSGATRLVLPGKVVEHLGLALGEKVKVVYADKRHSLRHKVSNVWLKMLGRDGVFDALVEPKRDTALIGAIIQLPRTARQCIRAPRRRIQDRLAGKQSHAGLWERCTRGDTRFARRSGRALG